MNRLHEAVTEFETALECKPDDANATKYKAMVEERVHAWFIVVDCCILLFPVLFELIRVFMFLSFFLSCFLSCRLKWKVSALQIQDRLFI